MGTTKLHGYLDPELPTLAAGAIDELNQHAAQDLAKRSIPGGLILLVALVVSACASPMLQENLPLVATFSVMMLIVVVVRLLSLRRLFSGKMSTESWRRLSFITFPVSAAIWGIYVASSIYFYQLSPVNMIILMFTIGIAAGAATSLFIWKQLAAVYLSLVFMPVFITVLIDWHLTTASIIFGISAYLTFLIIQARRTNTEYWRALYVNKLLQQQTVDLENARQQAEEANRAKSEFLSSMSHELRTPLNAILGFTQLLATDPATPPTTAQKDSLTHITDASKHLLTLINQVLDLAKIEAGELELNIGRHHIGKLVNDCLPLIQRMADDKAVDVVIELSPDEAVNVDPMRLKQVLINLLSNGIKYNRRGGKLSLSYERLDQRLRVRIRDTGIGISEKHQQMMFRSFSRLGQENSATEGSGVGLVITRNLLDAMGGQLDFESRENVGSTFWFDLPLAQD